MSDTERPVDESGNEVVGMFSILLIGLSGLILAAALTVFTIAMYNDVERQQTIEKRATGNLAVQLLKEEQLQKLSQYRWIDRQTGVVAIPIDQAIAVLNNELQAKSSEATTNSAESQ